MKKIIIPFLFCVVCLAFLSINFNIKAEGETIVGESKYKEGELVEEYDLGYGVVEKKVTAESSSNLTGFNAAGLGGGGLNEPGKMYPQSVNILSVPASNTVKIVNYVNKNSYGWGRGTIKEVIKAFEKDNPGWQVIAAINGDFFDISGKHPLPDTTSGSCISNGDSLKAVGNTVLGFTNDGTTNSLVGAKTISFTDDYYLAVYNSDYEIIAEYKVDFVNPNEEKEGISIYYSKPYFIDEETKQRGYSEVSLPLENSYYVKAPERCIPFINLEGTKESFFGKGVVSKLTEEKINYAQFGVHSTNEELNAYLDAGALIRIQKNVKGDYANCDNLTGCGVELVNNGNGVVFNNKERHPRTMVGVREDGTILMVTVDGRHPELNMYGMTYDEQAALMESLDCSFAYNLDGGGSTTMIVRQGDELKVLNNPSDGAERRDANALLVVVPEFNLKISDVTDTSMTLSIPSGLVGVKISNVKLTIADLVYDLDSTLTIDNLNPNQLYSIDYSYDLTYRGETKRIEGKTFTVQMGRALPVVNNLKYQFKDGTLKIQYDIIDADGVIDIVSLYYSGGSLELDLSKNEVLIKNVRNFDKEDLELVLFVEINSQTDSSIVISLEAGHFEEIKEEPQQPINPEIPNEEPKENNNKKSCSCKSAIVFAGMLFASAIIIIFKKRH